MTPEIVVKDEITEADERAVREPLRAHNRTKTGFKGPNGELALLIRNEAGEVTGGLTARYGYQWMGIELLFVPEAERGKRLGTKLMQQAEAVARDNKLTGIWLDTFAFQARGFYEKLGFSVFGTINDYPTIHSRYFMQKRL
jgi:GNAT superfamily N-acetyltransferase